VTSHLEGDVVRQDKCFQQISDKIAQDSAVPTLTPASLDGKIHVTSGVAYVVA
jgi:hypothetical protein